MGEGETKTDTADKFGNAEEGNPNIVEAKRSCTDVLCLLIFIIAFILWIILAIMAFSDGCPNQCNDPFKLVYGYDSSGCRCGKDCSSTGGPDNSDKSRLYVPDPRTPSVRICLKACPTEFTASQKTSTTLGTYLCPGGACQTCPVKSAGQLCFANQRKVPAILGQAGIDQVSLADSCFTPFANTSDCWYPTYATDDVFYKCVPTIPTNVNATTLAYLPFPMSSLGGATSVLANPAGDMGKMAAELVSVWRILLAAVGISIAMGFVYLLLLRLFAACCMWLTVIGLLISLLICTIFAWDMTGKVPVFATVAKSTGINATASSFIGADSVAQSQSQPALTYAVAVALTILTVTYVVVLCVMLRRLMIAVAIIQEAAKSMAAMPLLLLLPVTTFLALIVLYIWAGFITVYLLSAGQFDPATGKFVYAGGDCSKDVAALSQNLTQLTALVTLSFAAPGAAGFPAPAVLTLSHADLRGAACAYDPAQQGDVCAGGNTLTPGSARFPVGGCLGYLGGLGGNCTQSKALKAYYFAGGGSRAGEPGTVAWSPANGTVTVALGAGAAAWPAGGELRFALAVYPAAGAWDLAGAFDEGGGTWRLQTANVTSRFPGLPAAEASRLCNLHGGTAAASAAALAARRQLLAQQRLADAAEVTSPSFLSAVTLGTWRSALPVTLDGTTYNYFAIYHLFMFLWTNTFICSSAFFVVAGAVAGWYWAEDKHNLGAWPITASVRRYARYHTGTVLVGSFIIAVVQLIRILFNYYVRQCEKFKDNPLVKVMVCLVNCCLWCLEKVIGFINKNAYIMSATHGHGFCRGAFKGFCLVMRNLLRVAAVNVVAAAVFLFGKLFILASTMAICYLILQNMKTSMNLSSSVPFLAMVIVGILAWFIASAFLSIFEAAVDTIFLSFLHDSEANTGKDDKPYRMAGSLQSAIGVKNTPSAATVAPEP